MSELPRCSRVLLPSLAAGLGKESDLIIFGNNSTNYRMWTKKHMPKLEREGGREVCVCGGGGSRCVTYLFSKALWLQPNSALGGGTAYQHLE